MQEVDDERKARALELLEQMRVLSVRMIEALRVRKAIEAREAVGALTASEREEFTRVLQEVEEEYRALSAADAQLMEEFLREMAVLTEHEPPDS
jgi:hypothetical protein